MKHNELDPEVRRYRRSYPDFPGVKTCVELLSRGNVQGSYLEAVIGDLSAHAAANLDAIVVEFRASTDGRVRALLLSVLAETGGPQAYSIFTEALRGPDEALRTWAARGLFLLNTPEARRAIWQARSMELGDQAETDRFHEMLRAVERWS